MNESDEVSHTFSASEGSVRAAASTPQKRGQNSRLRKIILGLAIVLVIGAASTAWLGFKAHEVKTQLEAAAQLVPVLREDVGRGNADEAVVTLNRLRAHTTEAREATEDPLWNLSSAIPVLGTNFSAVAEVARSADDVSTLGIAPLVGVYESLNWDSLMPNGGGADLAPLQQASPTVMSAAHAVRASAERLQRIDANRLLPQVSEPLLRARAQLQAVTGALDASADASQIAPSMLGAGGQRNYLLMIQNNAEVRASGGIPGALAVLEVNNGKLSLGAQGTAGEIGTMSPVIPLEATQQQIYSGRMGKYMQDVNLTPDFPTAASTAAAMWERKNGQHVDGVISVDPIALAYILDATGPVRVGDPQLSEWSSAGLPTELNGQNVVPTLLSDVYAKIEEPRIQDAYFADAAQEIFAALSGTESNPKDLIESVSSGVAEGRISLWSALEQEQSIISRYQLGGSISGPSVSPAQFGVYFNDGTGAKMDYYVKRTVQLVKECPRDGYEETTVRVISTNTAPLDAASSLPAYVTGGGVFGVPPGTVQTNIVAYGPVQSNVETAKLNGQRTEFAPYLHSNRPVGILAIRLAPGESKTVEFTFGRIVQHTEPNVFVTPTVQPVKDVTLPTKNASCN